MTTEYVIQPYFIFSMSSFQHNHPYVSAMVSNGSLRYDHDTDGTHTQLAGCEAGFRNKDYDTYMAVRYEDQTLTVCYVSYTVECNI